MIINLLKIVINWKVNLLFSLIVTIFFSTQLRIISLLGFIVCRYRDFAYVARDRTTRKHMCHVFRCDIPARTIANTLRDICKKIMIERSLQQNLAKPIDISEYKPVQNKGMVVLTQTLLVKIICYNDRVMLS